MYRLRELWARLTGYRTWAHRDLDLDREIGAHLQMAIEEHQRAGLSHTDARRLAMRDFGGVIQTKEAFREQHGFAMLDSVARDVVYAWRLVRARPSFSAAVMLAIALGVGANTAVFAVAHGVLWRPLSFDEPDQLVRLFQTRPQDTRVPVSPLNYLDWATLSSSLDAAAAWRNWTYELTGPEGKDLIPGARVTASLFDVLRLQPSLGRAFLADEDRPAGQSVAVISDAFWRSRFGGNPDVIGRTLVAGDTVYAIVGVLPAGITFPAHDTAIWTPLRIGDGTHRMRRTENYLNVIARRKPGAELTEVQGDLDRLAQALAAEHPASNAGVGIAAVSLHDVVAGDARRPLLLLVGVAAAVLLISCANVAHLLLARTVSRGGELTVRAALGATRARLLRQNVTESVLLALGGGALGTLAAIWVIQALRPSLPAALPRRHEIAVDATVLGYALLCTAVVSALAATAPALRAWRVSLQASLKGSRQMSTPRATLLGRAAVLVQVALSLVLLIGTLLMLRSLYNVLTEDSGFVAENVIVTSVSLPSVVPQLGMSQAARTAQHFEAVVAEVREIRGVDAVGLVNHLPLSTDGSGTRFTVERRAVSPQDVPTASYRVVSPEYFTTLRARLLRGRYFRPSDRPESPPVFIVNEVMAARYWPGEDPIGSRIRRGGTDSKMPYTTIVGVVADMKQQGLDRQATPEIYIPHAQFPWPEMNLLVRTSRTVEDVAPDLRATLRRLNSGPSVQAIRAFEDVLWRTLNARAFAANLLVVCTGLAVILAMVGVYAVTAHATAAQTKEIAIRVALGASASSVLQVAIGGTIRVIGLALALGSVGAYGVARVMSSALFGIAPFDLLTYGVAALALGAIAAVAAVGPARKSLRIDPLVSLRAE